MLGFLLCSAIFDMDFGDLVRVFRFDLGFLLILRVSGSICLTVTEIILSCHFYGKIFEVSPSHSNFFSLFIFFAPSLL